MTALQSLFVSIAWWYPLWLLASFLERVVPRIAPAAARGDPALEWHVTPYGFNVYGGIALDSTGQMARLAILGIVALAGLRLPRLAGITLLSMGIVPAMISFNAIWNRPRTMPSALWFEAAFAVLALLAGFRLVASTLESAGFLRRLGEVVVTAVLPAAAMATAFRRGRGDWSWLLIIVTPLLLVAPLAVLRRAGARPPRAIESGWRGAAAGILLTATTVWAADFGMNRHMANRERAAREAAAALPAPDPNAPYPKLFFQKGVAFTAEAMVRYDSEQARQMLRQLPAWGVDSVALVPYGWSRVDPPRISPAGMNSWENDLGVRILAATAHQLGMKVLLKPHIWRPPDENALPREAIPAWFDQLESFAAHYATLARDIHADVFCVGTELGWLAREEQHWRRLIAKVRTIYPGPITYAATQGPEFETIRFWDALDYIGIDNYYPLGPGYSTSDMLAKIEEVRSRFPKPVLFTEAGFASARDAHKHPWADNPPDPLSLEEQVKCYRALLESFYDKPWFYGVYWWKVGTNGYGGPENNSMTPWRKPAMETVREWYTGGRR